MTVGIPSIRTPPSGFGISTPRTGLGFHVPFSNFSRTTPQCLSRWGPSCSLVMPSIPAASDCVGLLAGLLARFPAPRLVPSDSRTSLSVGRFAKRRLEIARDRSPRPHRFLRPRLPRWRPQLSLRRISDSSRSRSSSSSSSVLWFFRPSLHRLSSASSLLWRLLTSARLSSCRSPRVNTGSVLSRRPALPYCLLVLSGFVVPSQLAPAIWPHCRFV